MKKMAYRVKLFLFSLHVLFSCSKSPNSLEIPVKNGLIAYYPFNANANDESGNNYNLTVNGAILTNDRFGVASKAYSFNGLNSRMEIPRILIGDKLIAFTISIWVKPAIITPFILSLASKNTPIREGCFSYLSLAESSGNYLVNNYIVTNTELCTVNGIQDQIPNPVGKWNHLVLVQYLNKVDNNNNNFHYLLFFNGKKLEFGSNGSSSYNPTPVSFNYGGVIGCDLNGLYQFFKGDIDDFRLYNRAISDEEIVQLFNLKS